MSIRNSGSISLIVLVLLSGSFQGCASARKLTEKQKAPEEQPQVVEASSDPFLNPDQKLKNPANFYLKAARWQEHSGQLPEARKSYLTVLKESAKIKQGEEHSVEAQIGLARLDQLSGRTEDAEATLKKLVRSHPQNPQVLDALGQFQASQNRMGDAVQSVNKAVQLAPDERNYRHHLAVLYCKTGEDQKAFEQFRKVVGDAGAHYNLGYMAYKEKQYDKAEERFKLALEAKPDLKQAENMLATIGQLKSGKESLNDSFKLAEFKNSPSTPSTVTIKQTARLSKSANN